VNSKLRHQSHHYHHDVTAAAAAAGISVSCRYSAALHATYIEFNAARWLVAVC